VLVLRNLVFYFTKSCLVGGEKKKDESVAENTNNLSKYQQSATCVLLRSHIKLNLPSNWNKNLENNNNTLYHYQILQEVACQT